MFVRPYPNHTIPEMYQGLCHEDPEVFFLGEFHEDIAEHNQFGTQDRKANAILIEALYQEGDVVLVETDGQPPTLEGQTAEVWRNFELRGWDSPEARMAMASLTAKGYLLLDRCEDLLTRHAETDCDLPKELEGLLPHLPCELHPSVMALCDDGLLSEYKHESILFVVDVCSRHIKRTITDIINSDMRQHSLLHRVLEAKKVYRHLYVMTGKAHLYAHRGSNDVAQRWPSMLQESLRALDIKYVVLDRDQAITEGELDQQLSSYRTTAALCSRAWRLFMERLVPFLKRHGRCIVDLLLNRPRPDPRWDHRVLCEGFRRLSQEGLRDPATKQRLAELSKILEERTTAHPNLPNHHLAESVVGEGSDRLT